MIVSEEKETCLSLINAANSFGKIKYFFFKRVIYMFLWFKEKNLYFNANCPHPNFWE
jgi:hypothetical protein